MKRLTKALAVIGALSLVAALAGGIGLMVAVRHGFSARDQPSAMEAVVARAMREASIPARARALINPLKATPDVLADARAHWADHCAACHANNGSGDTQMGKNLYPKAPDMRRQPTQGLSDGELYFIIENGIRLTGMPAWGKGDDDDEDTWKLVAFIRHLPALTREEQQEMERMTPKSLHEEQEEKEEEEFLKGRDVSNTK